MCALLLLLSAFLSAQPARADEACELFACGESRADSVTISIRSTGPGDGTRGTPTRAERAGAAAAGQPGRTPLRQFVPGCSGNGPGADDALCTAATQTCPTAEQTRFWVYEQVWNPAGQPPAYGPPQRRAGSVCLAPDEPDVAQQVDPRVLVAATVRRDWRTYGLPAGRVITRPAGQTLTGAITQLSTSVEPQAVLHRTVLGLPVALTVTAQSYSWDFGDGTGTDQRAGELPSTEHTYTRTAALAASLTVIYTGSFTIGEDPQAYEVEGTATVPGPEQPLVVRQARTQLEDD